ncbi:hypothetical protein SDAV_00375 [Spiroplasma phoeniceum P40]|uniref:Uncharacterized protein n=1 Tax=Spiroplasma phoeniceum P40 TaxID=1276259 RepID=A0A345DMD1_9MOLU|nr:hypothetical protein SDAV_00375 [Spiroplasma phoeniceum P40]
MLITGSFIYLIDKVFDFFKKDKKQDSNLYLITLFLFFIKTQLFSYYLKIIIVIETRFLVLFLIYFCLFLM